MTFEVVRVKHRIPPPIKPRADMHSRVTIEDVATAAERLTELAEKLRPPLNSRPAAFHEDKSELVSACRELRDAVRSGRKPIAWA